VSGTRHIAQNSSLEELDSIQRLNEEARRSSIGRQSDFKLQNPAAASIAGQSQKNTLGANPGGGYQPSVMPSRMSNGGSEDTQIRRRRVEESPKDEGRGSAL